MGPVKKLREILRSVDLQLKQNRGKVDALEQGMLAQTLRIEQDMQARMDALEKNVERYILRETAKLEQDSKSKLVSMENKFQAAERTLQKEFRAVEQTLQKQLQDAEQDLQSKVATVAQDARLCDQHLQELERGLLEKTDFIESQIKHHKTDEETWKKILSTETWMEKYGYDCLFSNLQLAVVEQQVKGNRQRLQALKDTHKGETCFIIGNGPSLRAEDLSVLKQNHAFCFASKRINKIYSETDWRPDVWAASDLGYIESYYDEISAMEEKPLMLPCQSIINQNLPPIANAIYYPFLQVGERSDAWFNYDIEKGVHFWGTITVKMINFAVYMGFTKIYLLGVDNSFPVKTNEDGTVVFDLSQKQHFSNSYNTQQEMERIQQETGDLLKSFEYITKGFHTAKYFCDLKGIEIYNATRGGKLEVFPRVNFDELF